ncbi:MAG: hypothetical protein R3338_11560 [Thermoanaerobaculia bacterium]|nr:hypothetical protein [Thermoanaerobaculia bacterium]
MRYPMVRFAMATVLVLICSSAEAGSENRFDLDVLVDHRERAEYRSGSTVYIEALDGREYALRMTNPTPYRVAVALSVDGLNTIDARHTDPWNAAKWVLDPYESVVISGWQVDFDSARRFYFTTEEASYAASLGQGENLGVIEAVVYRERMRRSSFARPKRERDDARAGDAAPAPSSSEMEMKSRQSVDESVRIVEEALPDRYAATGMGDAARHEVRRIHLELERHPIASVRIRYEFRPHLVELGILPDEPSPLERREHARGFEFCPEP